LPEAFETDLCVVFEDAFAEEDLLVFGVLFLLCAVAVCAVEAAAPEIINTAIRPHVVLIRTLAQLLNMPSLELTL